MTVVRENPLLLLDTNPFAIFTVFFFLQYAFVIVVELFIFDQHLTNSRAGTAIR
jgi:hypothetical protein